MSTASALMSLNHWEKKKAVLRRHPHGPDGVFEARMD